MFIIIYLLLFCLLLCYFECYCFLYNIVVYNDVYNGVVVCCCLQKVQERWYESLHDWEAAYKAYTERQQQRPDDISLTLGKMRCLHAMGEW